MIDLTRESEASEVRRRLDAMLATEAFRQSPQLSAFLSYIVNETLAGRGSELKGYSIATMALGRPDSFDPQTDPIVRVQAGRLRQMLAAYHANHPDDPIAIVLDKGTYAPRFVRLAVDTRESPAGTAAPSFRLDRRAAFAAAFAALALLAAAAWLWRAPPSTAASPESFAPMLTVEEGGASGDAETASIVERARDALARFDDLVVVREGSKTEPAAASSRRQRLVLRLSPIEADGPSRRYAARLVDAADQTVIWSQEYGPLPAGPGGAEARKRLIRSVVTTIAQPYGVIHAHLRGRMNAGARRGDPYGCIVAGFDYWRVNDARTHLSARNCLTELLVYYPTLGGLHAQLAYLHLEEHRQGYNPLPGNPLDRALDSAQRAVTYAPASARSHQALLAAHFGRGERESAWRAAERAMALNPYDTEIQADVGARYVQSDQPVRGLAMIEEALDFNPAPPAWAVTFKALGLYLLNRLDESGPLAAQLRGTEYAPAMMALLMVARQRRDEPAAKEAYAALGRRHPGIREEPAAYLRRLAFDESVIQRIVKDFATSRDWAAGLP